MPLQQSNIRTLMLLVIQFTFGYPMASSDEEGEIVPEGVNDYYFIDDKYQPVSLSILPLLMSMDEIKCDSATTVYLCGTADDGMQEIFKQIIAWKFELSSVQPEISVLSNDKVSITLQRPRKNHESIIRTVLVTLYWLHFVRRNPEESRMSVWKYLQEVFSSSDIKLSEDDIQNHVSLIREAAERDKDLAKSEYLLTFIKNPSSNEVFPERQLKVYLPPFPHCKRYTSFGSHFTKLDKLKEVVDWYVESGDTIVDFCCGSNDFSCLIKSKLDQTGKTCSFKNYDIFQAKNDFCFEKRDWMSVNAEELPNGSQLIMGLNPPFGVHGFHADKFIDKALEFKPKLLILIVPKETERLDREKGGYNLIWEDDNFLSGKSFYLPGSVDIHNKQMEDWNMKPPPLYLWSRPDWMARHTEIALKHGHIREEDAMHVRGYPVNNHLMEERHDCYQNDSGLHAPDDVCTVLDGIPENNGNAMSHSKKFA